MDIELCTYCGKPLIVVFGSELYPNRPELTSITYWRCKMCDAHSATDKRTTLANRTLRTLRVSAHVSLDKLWKSKLMTRNEVYVWLSKVLQIPEKDTHIGLFDESQCWQSIINSEDKFNVLSNI